jgi:signal transduction histidine kinase/ActR/RegA family two-component response regulator
MTAFASGSWLEFSPETLDAFFPFSIRLSAKGEILGVGSSLRKVLPKVGFSGRLSDHFESFDLLNAPHAARKEAMGLPLRETHFLVAKEAGLKFKAYASELVPGGQDFFVVLAPPVYRLEDIGKLGLQFTDFGVIDSVVDFLMLLHSTQLTTSELMTSKRKTELQGKLSAALSSVSLLFAESQDMTTIFQKLLREVCVSLGWKIGHLFWVEKDAESEFLLDSGFWHLAEPERFAPFVKATRQIRFRPGVGTPGQALEQGKVIWRNALKTGVNLPRNAYVAELGLRTGVAIPVRVEGKVQAVIEFFLGYDEEYVGELGKFFEVLQSQVGLLLERQISEEKIRKSASELKVFFDSMRSGAFLIDAETGLLLRANPALAEMLACSREALESLRFSDFSFDEASGLPLDIQTLISGRYLFSRADGSQFHGELWIKRLSIGIGGVSGAAILAFITDLTERERAMALAAENSALVRTAAMKDEFLSSMSHELRTPLNSILGLTEVLLQGLHGTLAEPQANSLRIVESSARHLLALINDILDLSKIESGKMQLSLETVQLESLVSDTLLLFRESTLKRGIRLVTEDFSAVPAFQADSRRIKQVLVNLIGNAQKFTSEGGAIGVSAVVASDGSSVHVTVWDTGIGIPEADFPKLFQSFVQLDGGLSRNQSGTGLGLNLVSKLVTLHGGAVDVQSQEGKGSAFCFALPLRSGEKLSDSTGGRLQFRSPLTVPELALARSVPPALATSHAAVPVSAPAPVPSLTADAVREPAKEGARRLLLVENDVGNASFLGDFLQSNGFEIRVVATGAEALRVCEQETLPEVVLLDFQLPDLTGFELVPKLRALPGGIGLRVVAVTSLAMPGDEARCLKAGCDAYFSKPVNLGKLLQKLHGYKSQ